MTSRLHGIGAAVLMLASAGLVWHGQPDPGGKWTFLASELGPRLDNREVQIEPAELLHLMHDDYIDLHLIDLRTERDWNLFHLWGAERIAPEQLVDRRRRFANLGENAVIVLVGNDEAVATGAWQVLMATASRPNAYILAGGINRWLDDFAPGQAAPAPADSAHPDDTLRHSFRWALGSRHPAAFPDVRRVQVQEFNRKVKLQKKAVKKGGCG